MPAPPPPCPLVSIPTPVSTARQWGVSRSLPQHSGKEKHASETGGNQSQHTGSGGAERKKKRAPRMSCPESTHRQSRTLNERTNERTPASTGPGGTRHSTHADDSNRLMVDEGNRSRQGAAITHAATHGRRINLNHGRVPLHRPRQVTRKPDHRRAGTGSSTPFDATGTVAARGAHPWAGVLPASETASLVDGKQSPPPPRHGTIIR